MVLNTVPIHDIQLFTWCKRGNVWSASCERSDLGHASMAGRVYDDACDVGFFIHNPETKRSVLFTLSAQVPTKDSEIESWIFRSRCGTEVTVYND